MADMTGESIGRYHILEQLGEGGMATVYKAYDTRLERDVAIKVIRIGQFAPDQLENVLKRFEREAKALARLTHPNIVPVIDYGDHEGAPYLVMPYLPGGTLKKLLGTPMPWPEAVRMLLPIAQALEYAHEQNIIHRDIKPGNILLTLKDQPLLSDFGIARILEGGDTHTLTGTGVGIGTPEYMAPEQWMGESGVSSDVYALGVVLYELVTGRKPYIADTPAAILLKQASEPLPRPGQFVSGMPEQVEKILLKALAKAPADRYESMGAFARALEALGEQTTRIAEPETRQVAQVPVQAQVDVTATAIKMTPPASPRVESKAPAPARRKLRWQPWAIGAGVLLLGALIVALILVLRRPIASMLAKDTSTPTFTRIAPSTPRPTQTSTQTASPTELLEIGSTWTRPADGMVMMYVPAGEFTMGYLAEDARSLCLKQRSDCLLEWFTNEEPVHTVYLDAFWIDFSEVTNAMYRKCVEAKVCTPPQSADSATRNGYFIHEEFSDYPVIRMTWEDARTYCEWAGARLPTEAEWEKAARGTDARIYPWGGFNPTCELANMTPEGGVSCLGDTSQVGSHHGGASPYGLQDMAGNAWEWVADWFNETYYASSPASNPAGPETGTLRVMRGGSWSTGEGIIRTTLRGASEPENGRWGYGFRCAHTP